MNVEQFLTCVRAYFPGAKVKYISSNNGDLQRVTFSHPKKYFPHNMSLCNYYNTGETFLQAGILKYPISIIPDNPNPSLTEETLLKLLKRLNNRGWCTWQDIDE